MTTYITLLRGINVGGNRMIKMDALRQMMSELGFSEVKTYIQSGNIIFQTATTKENVLEQKITKAITTQFGFEVPVLVKNVADWAVIIASNPFLEDETKDMSHFHITFLAEKPKAENTAKIKAGEFQDDDFAIIDDAVYLYCPNGYSNSKLTNGFLESKLKVVATTRNWKTSMELLSMAS